METDTKSNVSDMACKAPEQLAGEYVIGYVATRDGSGTWMYLGETAEEVGQSIAAELHPEIHDNGGLSLSERDTIRVEPRLFTREQIVNMPDFPGW